MLVAAGSATCEPSFASTALAPTGNVIVTVVESGTMMAPAVLLFWMPLENATGRNPGSVIDAAAASGPLDPSGWPTAVPAATLMVVPAGSVTGVPAESAIDGPPFGRVPVTLASSVPRVLPAIGISGCIGWPG